MPCREKSNMKMGWVRLNCMRYISASFALSCTQPRRFPRREDVERSNTDRMKKLDTETRTFISIDGGSLQDAAQREKMLSHFMAPRELNLRVDAQVMLIKNLDDTLVNGSMGRIVRFVDPAIYNTEGDREQVDSELGPMDPGTNSKKGQPSNLGAKLYPVVEFVLHNNYKRKLLVQPENWKVELPSGEVPVSRTQVGTGHIFSS